MSFEFEDTKPNITNDALLADLQRVAAALGTSVPHRSGHTAMLDNTPRLR